MSEEDVQALREALTAIYFEARKGRAVELPRMTDAGMAQALLRITDNVMELASRALRVGRESS